MHKPYDSLNPHLKALVDGFSDWWSEQENEVDIANEVREPLYHYTDMGGLLGIISSEHIWFTSTFHLNDPSELSYGAATAIEILRASTHRANSAVEAFCDWMEHVLIKAGGEIFDSFVASFSQAPDDLGQWRAYADNGRGVAIGLAPSLFRVLEERSDLSVIEKTLAARVIYDRSECITRLAEPIQKAVDVINRGEDYVRSDRERDALRKEMAVRLAVPMILYSATCKHPAYAHEREWRLVILNQLNLLSPFVEMRVRGSNLVPYIPSPLRVRSPGAITKIIIGPAAEDLADNALRSFLRRQGLPVDIIEKSDIPYTAQ